MKRIWIGSSIVICLLILSLILDYYGIRISFFRIRSSHIIIVVEVLIILFYPKDQMFMFKMKFLAPLPNNNLSLGGERFRSYVLIEKAKLSQMFYSLSDDLDSLCFARYKYSNIGKWCCRPWGDQLRERIIRFNEENPNCFLGNHIFFLIKNNEQYLVTKVSLNKYPLKDIPFYDCNLFDSYTWDAGYHLVVPK